MDMFLVKKCFCSGSFNSWCINVC